MGEHLHPFVGEESGRVITSKFFKLVHVGYVMMCAICGVNIISTGKDTKVCIYLVVFLCTIVVICPLTRKVRYADMAPTDCEKH